MNEELQAQLQEVIRWLTEEGQTAGEFVKEQAPLVAVELLRYTIWYSSIMIGCYAVAIIVGELVCRKAVASLDKEKEEAEAKRTHKDEIMTWYAPCWLFFQFVLRCLPWLFLLLDGSSRALIILKCNIAPRLYILEYVKDTLS